MQTAIEECSTESKASPKIKQQKKKSPKQKANKKVSGQAYIFSSPQMTMSNEPRARLDPTRSPVRTRRNEIRAN